MARVARFLAELPRDGREVVVKIQRPDARGLIEQDLALGRLDGGEPRADLHRLRRGDRDRAVRAHRAGEGERDRLAEHRLEVLLLPSHPVEVPAGEAVALTEVPAGLVAVQIGADLGDPVASFNLGNCLAAQRRFEEAVDELWPYALGVLDEQGYSVMGGEAEAITERLKTEYNAEADINGALVTIN